MYFPTPLLPASAFLNERLPYSTLKLHIGLHRSSGFMINILNGVTVIRHIKITEVHFTQPQHSQLNKKKKRLRFWLIKRIYWKRQKYSRAQKMWSIQQTTKHVDLQFHQGASEWWQHTGPYTV